MFSIGGIKTGLLLEIERLKKIIKELKETEKDLELENKILEERIKEKNEPPC